MPGGQPLSNVVPLGVGVGVGVGLPRMVGVGIGVGVGATVGVGKDVSVGVGRDGEFGLGAGAEVVVVGRTARDGGTGDATSLFVSVTPLALATAVASTAATVPTGRVVGPDVVAGRGGRDRLPGWRTCRDPGRLGSRRDCAIAGDERRQCEGQDELQDGCPHHPPFHRLAARVGAWSAISGRHVPGQVVKVPF